MKRNVASQKIRMLVIDTSTNAPKTGDAANLTCYVSKDGGSVTVLGDTSATEVDSTNAKGLYDFDLTQGETDAHWLEFSGKSSTANVVMVPKTTFTEPEHFSSMVIDSNGRLDVSKIEGSDATNQIRDSVVDDTTRIDASALNILSSHDPGETIMGATDLDGGVTLASGAISLAKLGSDCAWLSQAAYGTAQAGGATTITLAAGASSTDDYHKGALIYLRTGTGINQSRLCTAYNGTTKVATVARAWATNPDNTTAYSIVNLGEGMDVVANIGTGSGLTALATQSSVDTIDTNVDTLLSRITSTLFSGITSLANWLGAMAGKQTANSTARTEIRATGAGSGTFDETTDSQEAVRDNMGTPQTGDTYATVNHGTYGNAAIKTQTAAIEVDTQDLQTQVGTAGAGLTAITSKTDLIANLYTAQIDFQKDAANTRDEYSVTWLKNGIPQTSGITSPTVQVVKRDATNLIASTSMTNSGSGVLIYNEATNRTTDGESYKVIAVATIDSASRTFTKWIGRDDV